MKRHQETPSILLVSNVPEIFSLQDSFSPSLSSVSVNLFRSTLSPVPVMRGVTRVSASLASTYRCFIFSGRPLSWVTANLVPRAMPSAPSARAATNPMPSQKPPAATTGILTLLATSGVRTMVLTGLTWPPASSPATQRISAPSRSALSACLTAPIWARMVMPCPRAVSINHFGLPLPWTITGTLSSIIASAILSYPGVPAVRFTPKGLSVSSLTDLISPLISSGVKWPAFKIPNPPALDTAATRRGTDIGPIGAWMIGYCIPSNSVILVRILQLLLLSKYLIVPPYHGV